MYKWKILPILLSLLFSFSCTRVALKTAQDALRQTSGSIELSDDLALGPLIQGLKIHQQILAKKPPGTQLHFGSKTVSAQDYARALERIIADYQKNSDTSHFFSFLKENFDFYEPFGRDDYGDIFLTSYFEPLIEGSLKPTEKFSLPLYRYPDDIVEVELPNFANSDYFDEPGLLGHRLFGRLISERNARGNLQVIPFYSRQEIDLGLSLKGRNLELCYVDPVDSFFLQIQGSGLIKLADGKILALGHAGQNGRRYVPIGRTLSAQIPLEEMNLPRLESYLRSLPKNEMMEILNRNPSYIFFKKLKGRPVTTIGTEVIDGRTIATDYRFFPKGVLAFLSFDKPVFSADSATPSYVPTSRLVIDQDTGGAIKGPDRVDLFWGTGEEAKKHAGVIKGKGKLYYLVPKE